MRSIKTVVTQLHEKSKSIDEKVSDIKSLLKDTVRKIVKNSKELIDALSELLDEEDKFEALADQYSNQVGVLSCIFLSVGTVLDGRIDGCHGSWEEERRFDIREKSNQDELNDISHVNYNMWFYQ